MAEFGKLNFSVSFNPTSAFPLDARCYFETLTAAQEAAASADVAGSSTTTYYYGQTLVVVEDGVATLYVIQPDKTLKAAGGAVLGDGKSISIVDGTVSIVGFEAAETGAQPRKKADGSIEWIKPDTTTVEGLQTAVEGLESDVEGLQTAVEAKADADNVYTKGEVDSKVAGVYRYKGSKATYAELPADSNAVGDVWNIAAADTEHGIKAGDNVAWTGEAWDVLAGTVDLSGYATTAALGNKVDKVEGSRLMTEAEGTKLAGIEAGAQANIIEVIKINGVDAPISEKGVNIPLATAEALGVVKSSAAENKVAVASDGTMEVNSLNISKITQTEGDALVLNGGDSNGN